MARFLKGITGAYTGKVGSIVGSSWRGIDYIRSLPKKSSKPATLAQIEQRTKFGMTTAFLKSIKDVVKIGFSDAKQKGKLGYNVAFKHLINNAVEGVYPTLEINYANVLIANGSLATLVGLSVQENAPQELTLTWQPDVNRFNAFLDDQVIVLLYNPSDNLFTIYEQITREDATMTISLPASYGGKSIVGWAFVIHREGEQTSASQYLGQIAVSA